MCRWRLRGRTATLPSGQGLNQAGYTSCWLRAKGSHPINIAVTNETARTAGHFSIGVMDLPSAARDYLVPCPDFVGSTTSTGENRRGLRANYANSKIAAIHRGSIARQYLR